MQTINPFFSSRNDQSYRPLPMATDSGPVYAKLPRAPINASPVPHLTSLYHSAEAGNYGSRSYPGNCGGNLIKDLIRFYGAKSVFDPMSGSGTAADVCKELGIYCYASDLRQGQDACDGSQFPRGCFDFAWAHPPYYKQKLYSEDSRCMSRTPDFPTFLARYQLLIENLAGAVVPGGKVAILMGDYQDRTEGFLPLVYHTKRLAFRVGLKQCATDIIRFSHGASSGKKVYRSSFIPGLHDTCVVFERP
jgi:hypothetical protein